ncbi:MAG: replication initiator protein A [Janthinobacterium lividum]
MAKAQEQLKQPDFFAPAFVDIPIRDQRDMMERPFFSLAKKPRKTPISYEVGGTLVKVYPVKEFGIATIWDADILIWAATQVTEAVDRGGETNPRIHFHPYQLLRAIRRNTGGDQYKKLQEALRRLASTYVETNIRVPKGSRKKTTGFHWLEDWDAHEDEDGKPTGMSLTLPRWLYDGIVEKGMVLTIHEDYFTITGGIERWLYRVARKHAGHQETGWPFTMRQLYDKSGSAARFSDFAIDVRKVVENDSLPEYALRLHKNGDGEEIVSMIRRSLLDESDPRFELPRVKARRKGRGLTQKALRFPI